MKICPVCQCGSSGSPVVCASCQADLTEVGDRSGLDLVGMVIGDKYELTELIGEGAMGWVYRGIHRSLQSSIAIKLMKPSVEPDDTRDKRFEQEARAASALNSPHIISIIDFGRTPGGLLFIISEFLRGDPLSSLIASQAPLPLPRALRIIDQILSAVYEAHEVGLVHRDMKPENVIITPLRSGEDFVKVLDFGIAKLGGDKNQRLTIQGQLFGTPAYMAPEQIRGQEVTPRTDLYACAIILYEMLTGFEPFRSESVMEVLSMQLHNDPQPLRDAPAAAHLPQELEAVLMKALSKDPADRFEDAAELRQALARFAGRRAHITTSRCAGCGSPMALGSKFCPECGARKSQMTRSALSSHGQPTGASPSPSPPSPVPGRGSPGSTIGATHTGPHSTLQRQLKAEKTLHFQLVGREKEIDQLAEVFGEGIRTVQVLGPDGIGRSSLLHAAGQLAERAGLRVLRAGPDPALTRRPWYPVHMLVRQLLDLGPDRPDLALLQERATRVGLEPGDLPGLAELFGISALEGKVEYAVRQREVRAAATHALLDSRGARDGLCVIIDDADAMDGASRALINHLREASPAWPLHLVLAGESSVLSGERGSPAASSTGEAPLHAAVTIRPAPLTPREVETLLADTISSHAGSAAQMAAEIFRHTQGIPFAVTQSLRLMVEGGDDLGMSPADVIATRVSRLPRGSLRVLQTICLVGTEAPTSTIEALHSDGRELSAAILLLERRGFLEKGTDATIKVSHPTLAEHVREGMPADARRQLHQRVYDLLLASGAQPITLARHALACLDAETTLDILTRAGEQAESWLDDVGAAYHFQQALQVARYRMLLEPDHRVCLELTLRLARTLRFSGDAVSTQLVLKDALLVSEANPALHARLLKTLALVFLDRAATNEALRTMEQALRSAIMGMDPELLNEMYIELGKVLMHLGRWDTAKEELGEGILLVTGGDGPDARVAPSSFWRLLSLLAEVHMHLGDLAHALSVTGHALEQAQRADTLIGQARCHHQLSQILDQMDREGSAEEHHTNALAAFRRLGDRKSTAECMIAHASRRPAEHLDLLQEARHLADQIGWPKGAQVATSLARRGDQPLGDRT